MVHVLMDFLGDTNTGGAGRRRIAGTGRHGPAQCCSAAPLWAGPPAPCSCSCPRLTPLLLLVLPRSLGAGRGVLRARDHGDQRQAAAQRAGAAAHHLLPGESGRWAGTVRRLKSGSQRWGLAQGTARRRPVTTRADPQQQQQPSSPPFTRLPRRADALHARAWACAFSSEHLLPQPPSSHALERYTRLWVRCADPRQPRGELRAVDPGRVLGQRARGAGGAGHAQGVPGPAALPQPGG